MPMPTATITIPSMCRQISNPEATSAWRSMLPMAWCRPTPPQIESHERRNPIARVLDRFNRWFDRMADRYKDVIGWALDHRLAMVLLAVGTFAGAIAMAVTGVVGSGFVP